jgi:hypothetical protein
LTRSPWSLRWQELVQLKASPGSKMQLLGFPVSRFDSLIAVGGVSEEQIVLLVRAVLKVVAKATKSWYT